MSQETIENRNLKFQDAGIQYSKETRLAIVRHLVALIYLFGVQDEVLRIIR